LLFSTRHAELQTLKQVTGFGITTLLFARAGVGSGFGAAGSLIVILA